MPNPFLPRDQVHTWSEHIGNHNQDHQAALQRLVRSQNRLVQFIRQNAKSLQAASGGFGVYLMSVIARMLDLAGGKLKSATWAQVREAERLVGEVASDLLPIDDAFAERVRKVPWRAQPHILDEALFSLLEREPSADEEVKLSKDERVKVFFLAWVCTEVLDRNWTPPAGFTGETSYTFQPIDPSE